MAGQKRIEERLERVETKQNVIYNQVADLTEFKTETQQSFTEIKDMMKFLLYKDTEHEKDIYILKKKSK